MENSRRRFLRNSSLLAAGALALPGAGLSLSSCSRGESKSQASENGKLPFGIQLWTLRDDFPGNEREVLERLAGYGYSQIESFEGPEGMFWGYGHKDFSNMISDLGMKLVASHTNINEKFEEKAEQAAEAGLSYLVSPWIGGQETLDDYKRYADTFNDRGRICKEAGIRFAYHNHEYTFEKIDGIFPQDVLMENTDPELVDFELDIYWVAVAQEDPAKWIEKYPGRFTLSHVKDRADVPADVTRASTTLGTGVIEFPELLKKARENGMKYFFVEQEEYEGTTPLDAVREGAKYMKGLDMFKARG